MNVLRFLSKVVRFTVMNRPRCILTSTILVARCRCILSAMITLLALAAACTHPPPGESRGETGRARVLLQTALGGIEIEVEAERAPITAANFLRYVDAGLYDGARFHRTVRLDNQPDDAVLIEVVQAGLHPDRAGDEFPPIPLERTDSTGLAHRDGTVSMARLGPDTATSDFFICIGDQPALDFGGERNPDGEGFAAFGRVIEGMEVVRRIHAAPAVGQTLRPPIGILRATRSSASMVAPSL